MTWSLLTILAVIAGVLVLGAVFIRKLRRFIRHLWPHS